MNPATLSLLPTRNTRDLKVHSYPDDVRRKALRLSLDGTSLRRIAHLLGVHYTRVMLWIKAHAHQLPHTSPQPNTAKVIEMDELYPCYPAPLFEFCLSMISITPARTTAGKLWVE